MELQADCYAGVWGHRANKRGRAAEGRVELDQGRLSRKGINAAAAIGDDRMHASSSRAASRPIDSRTARRSSASNGSAAGSTAGNPDACNTFQ